jgi:tRNA dimethylallyltransferase
MRLAEALGGVIINADSMQVYRDLRVLTARPSEEEEARVRHELYGFVGAGDAYSVGRYVADAAVHYRAVREAGQAAIFVGGTGLYFRGLLEGLSPIPRIDPDVRARWRAFAAEAGGGALHEALKARDGVMAARLPASDVQRIVRALEVVESTGRSLDAWQRLPGVPVVEAARALKLAGAVDRQRLYQRSDVRFDAMIKGGALFEVARLQAMQLDAGLPIMRALGVRALIDYIEGRASLEVASERAKTETRQYIKRQLTWLRRNMLSWKLVDLFEMESKFRLKDIFG